MSINNHEYEGYLTSIIGDIRSGKTLLAVFFLSQQKKRDIYSNITLKFPNYKPLYLKDLFSLENVDILLDELYMYIDARKTQQALNIYLSQTVCQMGKRKCDIYYTAQMFHTVEMRVREQSKLIIEAKDNKELQRYEYIFYQKVDNEHIPQPFDYWITYEQAEKYYPLFDTSEIVEPLNRKKRELDLLKLYPEMYDKEVKKIAKEIKPKIDKITHVSVKGALRDIHIRDKEFENDIYLELKKKG